MYKIVADSSCDLITDSSMNFASVPMLIYTDTYKYLDDNTTPVSQMLDVLEKHSGRSYTACPGATDWIDAMDNAEEVYVMCITSGLSGAYNSAVTAADMYLEDHPDARIKVFDSLSTGPEMRMAIEKIQTMKDAGASFEEVCTAIPTYLENVHLLFMLNSLHNLAENGRVNKVIASAANILGISVIGIASVEGTIQQIAKARGEKKVVSTLLKEMKSRGYNGGKVAISHVENELMAFKIKAAILNEYHNVEVSILPSTGLCSFYAERGGILLGFEK